MQLNATELADNTAPTVDVTAGSVNAQNAASFQLDVSTEPASEPTDVTVTLTGPDGETVDTQTSVTSQSTVSLNLSTFADGEVTIDVTATDAGNNSDTASTAVTKDTVAPEIEAATTNAGTDAVTVTVNESVAAVSVTADAFDVTSPVHTVDSATLVDAQTVAIELNRSVPAGAINTSSVQISAPGVTDDAGNGVANAVNFTDEDAPSITSISAERNATTLTVAFGEVVTGGEDALNASDFVYSDTNQAGASEIVALTRLDSQTVELTVNETLTPSDLEEDTIAVAEDSVFDAVGNAAPSEPRTVGFEASSRLRLMAIP